ncbi:MAG: aminotransferase class V-fold PLP-dependent enzyme, partial [Halobacteriota archaeon]
MKIANNIPVREVEEDYINIQPIQAAGRLTGDAMKALIAYGDGYSTCDQCRKPFRLDKITKPNIAEFHNDLAEFLHMEEARVTPGARRAFQAVCLALAEKGDTVLVSALAHYTEFLAVENANAVVNEIPLNEKNVVNGDAVAQKIEDVTREQGKKPALVMLDHFDYSFANEHHIASAARAAHQYDIPILYNGAYTVGIKPVDGKQLGVDFVVGSGHKSMASPAPSGVLATTSEYADQVFRTTQMIGDVTGRKFGIKEVEMLGCTLMGANIIAMMASFPTVQRRVNDWQEYVEKSNFVIDAL